MKAHALVYMTDGRSTETDTTRAALADFFRRNESSIAALLVDVNLTRWFWTPDTGWQRAIKFRYQSNTPPETWRREPKPDDLKPTAMTPFDRI